MHARTLSIVCLFLLLLMTPAGADSLPKILVINSYHVEYPWVMSHNSALRKGLEGVAELEFFNMDTKRIHPAHHQERANLALAAYRNAAPALVILTDDNALAFLGREITTLGTPVIYLGVNSNPRHYIGDNPLITGVLERPHLKRSVVFLHEILGEGMDKCLVLFDDGPTARVIVDTTFNGGQSLEIGGIATDIVLTSTFEQWKEQVQNANERGYGAIILGLYHTLTDKDGQHVSADTIANWTSSNTRVPIFGFWDFSVGSDKAIGGLILAGEPQGTEAAKLARRVLAGEPINEIAPVTAETGRFLFSRSQLLRWRIALDPSLALPSEILEFVD